MSRVGSISLVLLIMVASSLGFYRTRNTGYGKRYKAYNKPRTYGSVYASGYGSSNYGSGYGSSVYGYGSGYGSTYKKSYSAVSKAPLCKANGRIMLRLYIEDGGTPVSNAKVNYVDNKLIDTVSTDLYGYIAIPVYGCTVALIVYRKDGNPVFKTVDLLSCTTREEKVVLDLDDKCNFNLYFAHEAQGPDNDDGIPDDLTPCASLPCDDNTDSTQLCAKCGDENQLVSFTYKSDDHTGYEQAVAGTAACITAGDAGDELIVMLKTQYANIFNVFNFTITTNRYAVIALPPQLVEDSANTYDETKYDIVFISNTYEDDLADVENKLVNRIDDWQLVPKTGDTIDKENTNTVTDDTFTDVSSFGVEAGELEGNKWLLAVQFHTSEDDDTTDDVDLEGNVVVIDCDGNYQTVESDTEDYLETGWFLVGCFCKNAPSMKAGEFIALGVYTTSAPNYSTHCNDECVKANS